MIMEYLMFGIPAAIALFGSVMIILQRNPVASVLYLVLTLIAMAILYVQLGAMFLGAILIVVYAGAIMILFLFVIMLLNIRGSQEMEASAPSMSRFSKTLVGSLFLVELIFIVFSGQHVLSDSAVLSGGLAETATEFGSVSVVAKRMFREFLYPFELTGILMLIAIVGAVVIAKRDDGEQTDSAINKPRTDEGSK